MKEQNRERATVDRVPGRGVTLRALELLRKIENDVVSILGAPLIPVPKYIYGRNVSRQLCRGSGLES